MQQFYKTQLQSAKVQDPEGMKEWKQIKKKTAGTIKESQKQRNNLQINFTVHKSLKVHQIDSEAKEKTPGETHTMTARGGQSSGKAHTYLQTCQHLTYDYLPVLGEDSGAETKMQGCTDRLKP